MNLGLISASNIIRNENENENENKIDFEFSNGYNYVCYLDIDWTFFLLSFETD